MTHDARRMADFRIGIGYDIHRLVEGRPLILGGIEIAHTHGLLGHSDGDALLHAISDAMLGALSLGDIGRHFPDTDPAFKGADSAKLLLAAYKMVADRGWLVTNVDANIIAQAPKMAPHVVTMIARIAGVLDTTPDRVSVKARTNEGLDSVGEGRAIVCQAVVLLKTE